MNTPLLLMVSEGDWNAVKCDEPWRDISPIFGMVDVKVRKDYFGYHIYFRHIFDFFNVIYYRPQVDRDWETKTWRQDAKERC